MSHPCHLFSNLNMSLITLMIKLNPLPNIIKSLICCHTLNVLFSQYAHSCWCLSILLLAKMYSARLFFYFGFSSVPTTDEIVTGLTINHDKIPYVISFKFLSLKRFDLCLFEKLTVNTVQCHPQLASVPDRDLQPSKRTKQGQFMLCLYFIVSLAL